MPKTCCNLAIAVAICSLLTSSHNLPQVTFTCQSVSPLSAARILLASLPIKRWRFFPFSPSSPSVSYTHLIIKSMINDKLLGSDEKADALRGDMLNAVLLLLLRDDFV